MHYLFIYVLDATDIYIFFCFAIFHLAGRLTVNILTLEMGIARLGLVVSTR